MATLKESLTFDDVTLIPQFSSILPSEANVETSLGANINLKIPFLSSAMDTITESSMAIAIAKEGGLGVIHRNLSIKEQCAEVKKVKKKKLIVGAAIGTSKEDIYRANKLIENNIDMLVIDTAHGHSKKVLDILKKLKKIVKKIPICAGNIATAESARALSNEGADILKVGIGPGSICTTRIVSGIGVPQISAVMDVKKGIKKNKKTKIISDGGVKFLGDAAKAIAAGADAVMMGSVFAGTEETPGKIMEDMDGHKWKIYRGMASKEAQIDWKGKYSSFEGVATRVPCRGSASAILEDLCRGIKSGLSYSGARTIPELQARAEFIKQSSAGQSESATHILARKW